jgi:hypothetical protein
MDTADGFRRSLVGNGRNGRFEACKALGESQRFVAKLISERIHPELRSCRGIHWNFNHGFHGVSRIEEYTQQV